MNIGTYTFEEFKDLATQFHGYPAPGLLIGGYMVELAKSLLPENTLFEAVVESKKCLPDAVQLLTLCSIGNNWLKIHNLGKYALSLFDKFTGEGFRVSINIQALKDYSEIEAWFLKQKPKKEQDSALLLSEIEKAGSSLCSLESVSIKKRFLGHKHMTAIDICPICGEAFPEEDGIVCRGCQGDAPYIRAFDFREYKKNFRTVPVEDAIGKCTAHDMTRIDSQIFKGVEFAKGHIIKAGDLCRLQQMGRFNIAIAEDEDEDINSNSQLHENIAALKIAERITGQNIQYSPQAKEGKITLKASVDGLLVIDTARLYAFNLMPDMMIATRHHASIVKAGSEVAATRIIPLYTDKENLMQALRIIGENPLLNVVPLRKARVGILVTGTEVFQGLIEDKFIPVISAKVLEAGCEIVEAFIVPDNKIIMQAAVKTMRQSGVDLLITTGGLSVDPDDITREVLIEAGLTNVVYGIPILPGAMSLTGNIDSMQVLGVPACALFYKTTAFDLLFARLLAGLEITRHEMAKLGEGGLCLQCKNCTYPHCSFGK